MTSYNDIFIFLVHYASATHLMYMTRFWYPNQQSHIAFLVMMWCKRSCRIGVLVLLHPLSCLCFHHYTLQCPTSSHILGKQIFIILHRDINLFFCGYSIYRLFLPCPWCFSPNTAYRKGSFQRGRWCESHMHSCTCGRAWTAILVDWTEWFFWKMWNTTVLHQKLFWKTSLQVENVFNNTQLQQSHSWKLLLWVW